MAGSFHSNGAALGLTVEGDWRFSPSRDRPTGIFPHQWCCGPETAILLGDLLWFAYGRSTQCDPSLYYPRIPVLEELAAAPPGRIIGYHCFPATLAQTQHLRDIRGYDGVDPARLAHPDWIARHGAHEK
jgi:hypothetical protein